MNTSSCEPKAKPKVQGERHLMCLPLQNQWGDLTVQITLCLALGSLHRSSCSRSEQEKLCCVRRPQFPLGSLSEVGEALILWPEGKAQGPRRKAPLGFLDMNWVHAIHILGMLGVLGVCNMLQDPWTCSLTCYEALNTPNRGGYGCKTWQGEKIKRPNVE